jgi:Ca2+-binding RTX toxin-like protein
MPQPNNDGSSHVSGSASSFVNDLGAGSSASVTATSPDGQISTSQGEVFTPGATSASAIVQGSASSNAPPETSVTVKAPADELPNDNKVMNQVVSGSEPSNDATHSGDDSPLPNSLPSDPIQEEFLKNSNLMSGTIDGDRILGSAARDRILGGEGADRLLGDANDDYLHGNQDNDWIEGNEGSDTLYGGQGNDVLFGGDGADRVFGDLGEDYLNGNLGEDVLDGGEGNDTLYGGQGNDFLFGGNGNDFLVGDVDLDILTGGKGADTFVLRTDTAVNDPLLADRLTDFNASESDRIGLTGGLSAATLVFEVFDSNADGRFDATLLKLNTNSSNNILGVVLNSVDVTGTTILTSANFITV